MVSSLERFLYPSSSLDIITNRPLWYISDSIVYTPRRCAAAWFQWQWHSSDRRHVTSWAGPDTRSGAILALCAGPHELTIVETRFSYSTLILSDAALVICSSAVVRYCCGPGESCDTDSASYLLHHRGRSWESSGNSWQRERERDLSVCSLPTCRCYCTSSTNKFQLLVVLETIGFSFLSIFPLSASSSWGS